MRRSKTKSSVAAHKAYAEALKCYSLWADDGERMTNSMSRGNSARKITSDDAAAAPLADEVAAAMADEVSAAGVATPSSEWKTIGVLASSSSLMRNCEVCAELSGMPEIEEKLVQAIEDAQNSCFAVQERLMELRKDAKVNGLQVDYLKTRLVWFQKPPMFQLFSNVIPWLREQLAAASTRVSTSSSRISTRSSSSLASSPASSAREHSNRCCFGTAAFHHTLLFCANSLREVSRVMSVSEALVVDCIESSKDWRELWILECILAPHEIISPPPPAAAAAAAAARQKKNDNTEEGPSIAAAHDDDEPLWSPFYLVLRDLHRGLTWLEDAYAELNELCGDIFHLIPKDKIKKTLDHRLEKDKKYCRSNAVKDTNELLVKCQRLAPPRGTNRGWSTSRSSSKMFRCVSYMLDKLNQRYHPQPGGPMADNLPQFLRIENNELEGTSEPFADGSFGYVSEGSWLKFPVAVKTMKSDVLKELCEEVAMLARVEHPNVVRLIGYCCIVRGQETTTRNRLVMERMSQDLRRLMDTIVDPELEDEAPPFPAPVALDIIMQLAEALRFLRRERVMHRDIKAKNVLINARAPLRQSSSVGSSTGKQQQQELQYYLVKLTDMGLSQYKLPQHSMNETKMKGATNWRAPEVFAENTSTYDWAADVYSFAMACYEVVSGKTPFYNVQTITYARLRKGERPALPSNCQPELADLIRECWATEPEKRPDISKICEKLQRCKEALLRRYNDYMP